MNTYARSEVDETDSTVELYLLNFWTKDLSIRDLADRIALCVINSDGKDPAAATDQNLTSPKAEDLDPSSDLESKQRKAIRLFYMVWSGVTKCLRNIVQSQKKAIEIKDFAIFGPIFDKG